MGIFRVALRLRGYLCANSTHRICKSIGEVPDVNLAGHHKWKRSVGQSATPSGKSNFNTTEHWQG